VRERAYTHSDHIAMKTTVPLNFIRSAVAPVIKRA
jgi:hypothetical protein